MANTRRSSFRKPQGDRRLAPAQVGAFCICAFLAGTSIAGIGIAPLASMLIASAVGCVRKVRKWPFLLVFLLPTALGFGVFYYHLYFALQAAHAELPFETKIIFSGIVAAEPGHGAKSEYFPLQLESPFRSTIRVIAAPDSTFRYGEELQFSGIIKAPASERDLPVTFFPVITRTAGVGGSSLQRGLFALKDRLISGLPYYLPSKEAAFMAGITLGEKADFSPDFLQSLAASGTTHLVALSGYNIAILVLIVFGSLLPLLGRRPAFYVTVTVILFFVLMVGTEPSVVRAAVMGFLALLAQHLGRPYALPHALLWAAFVMVLFDPASLFAPGFQLSFMALLGIVYLSPPIMERLGIPEDAGGLVPLAGFRENIALTLAAQIAVLPVAINNFGSVSLTSVPANALILPFMPLTMFFGFLLITFGIFCPPLAIFAGWIAHILLAYEIGVIRFFAVFSLPLEGSLPWWAVTAYYALLILWITQYRKKIREHAAL